MLDSDFNFFKSQEMLNHPSYIQISGIKDKTQRQCWCTEDFLFTKENNRFVRILLWDVELCGWPVWYDSITDSIAELLLVIGQYRRPRCVSGVNTTKSRDAGDQAGCCVQNKPASLDPAAPPKQNPHHVSLSEGHRWPLMGGSALKDWHPCLQF